MPLRHCARMIRPAALSLFFCSFAGPTLAAPPAMVIPAESDLTNEEGSGVFDFTSGIERNGAMLGNMWGARPWLDQYGISFGLQETSEVLGNVTGGVKKSFDYDGLTQATVQMDTQRAFGWYGGTFNASALQLHGENLSPRNLDTLQTSSGIESPRSTRLWELWYDQKFLDEDRMDIKVGQQSLDQEYMVSQNANLFVNTMFGWPALPTYDMPDGGPAYPLSAVGARVRVKPNDSLTFLGGVYNGSPAGRNDINNSGTGFPTDGGALVIGEMQYTYPALGSMVSADDTHPLSGTYKLGFWYDTENFPDEQFNNTGGSLAVPGSNPLYHHDDYAIYAVADQMIWNDPDDPDGDRTINAFGRVMGTPLADRNLLDFSMNAGLTLHEPFPHLDDDTAGIGMGYVHVSSAVAAYDEALTGLGTYTPTQTGETYVEFTYQHQLAPWWTVQPDFQYIFNPGGGVLDASTNKLVGNEAVLGVRTTITF